MALLKKLLIPGVLLVLFSSPLAAWGAPQGGAVPGSSNAQILATPSLPAQAGCYAESATGAAWQQVACIESPNVPMLPASGPASQQVGNGNDEVAVSSGTAVGQSLGSFPSVSGLTSETGSASCLRSNGVDCYSLQLNSNFWTPGSATTYTDGKTNYYGWEQFVFSNDCTVGGTNGCLYIQYWLINYAANNGGNCPTHGPPGGGWYQYSGDCYGNGPAVSTGPLIPATSLDKLSLKGQANYQSSGNDVVTLCVSGGPCYSVSTGDGVVDLYLHWQQSEFNVVGDASGSQANFNAGTSVGVSTSLMDTNGGAIVSSCTNNGTTGETNNLFLQPCSGGSSGITFVECLGTNPSSPSTCSTPIGAPEFPVSPAGQLATALVILFLAVALRKTRLSAQRLTRL